MVEEAFESRGGRAGTAGRVIGGALFLLILLGPTPAGLNPAGQRLAAVTLLMAVWWLTQAIPIAATSLIPLVAFPLLGIQSAGDVSASYINRSIFLFLGGFLVALGIEKWVLHRRMALHVIRVIGSSPKRVVLGFMLATAFLSMWISNTASTLLMMPIGLAMLTSLHEASGFVPTKRSTAEGTSERHPALDELATVLMLGIAYSASIGGLTTLVGTPTNIAFLEIFQTTFPAAPRISVGQWMATMVPLGAMMLIAAWALLVRRLPRIPGAENLNRRFFTDRLRSLGPPTRAEVMMFAVFGMTAWLWMFRTPLKLSRTFQLPGWGPWLTDRLSGWNVAPGDIDDSTVAIAMALLLFLLPAGSRDEKGRRQALMDWKTARRLPWGLLLLFGGGFAIAGGFKATGLSAWLGDQFADGLSAQPVWLIVIGTCLMMTFLTEFTSNVATVSTLMPILAAAAVKMQMDPRLIMIAAAVSASCAFMLPIATPPNAIVFGSGQVGMGRMARSGLALNLLGVLLVTAVTLGLLIPQFGISLDGLPTWAEAAAVAPGLR